MSQTSKKVKRVDVIVIAVILILVLILAIMGQRSCTITLTAPEGFEGVYVWCEVYNDGRIATCSDTGMVSQNEYALKYTAIGNKGETVVLFACLDPETGDELCDRVAYQITATGWGFLTATLVDIPQELEDITLPDIVFGESESQDVPKEPTDACGCGKASVF